MKLIILIGPPGSGKSTMARQYRDEFGYTYINQDSQGADHKQLFIDAIYEGKPVIVDRMNFNVQQRKSFIEIAKLKGYSVSAFVKCESYETCFARVMARENHETIKDEKAARGALQTFFTKYEPPTEAEGIDFITRIYPEFLKPLAIYCDLDGTLCDVEHRRHFVRPDPKVMEKFILTNLDPDAQPPKFKKDWRSFFLGIKDDKPIYPVMHLLLTYARTHKIVYCTGRDENYRLPTLEWLLRYNAPEGQLIMRNRNDSRQDFLVKEILLDFEVLPRYNVLFCLDDRDQVVQMLRRRGQTVFQVAEGDF